MLIWALNVQFWTFSSSRLDRRCSKASDRSLESSEAHLGAIFRACQFCVFSAFCAFCSFCMNFGDHWSLEWDACKLSSENYCSKRPPEEEKTDILQLGKGGLGARDDTRERERERKIKIICSLEKAKIRAFTATSK